MNHMRRQRGGGRGYRSALRAGPLALLVLIALAVGTAPAQAAGEPQIAATWTTEVSAGSASFHGEVNPQGSSTTCRFEYATDAVFKEKGFTGAAPASCEPSPGSGSAFVAVAKHVSALKANTTYHYRLSATNDEGTATSLPQTFTTEEIGAAFKLPDARGWELVSPADKNGGAVQGFEANHGGGVIQAAAQGNAITYTSASSFGGYEAQGAPQGNQYISRRGGAGGWSTQNITTPTVSGAYGNAPNGVPYQLFSPDLSTALLLNGVHCRGEGTGCPVTNPPLAGTEAPPGFQNYYLRDSEDNGFEALLTQADLAHTALSSSQLDLAFAGASPDLRHLVLSTCAALTPGASEVAGSEGCDPTKPNLYEWSGGALALINVAPGAKLAAQSGAVSADGSRVYFSEAGKLWLREGTAAPHELAAGAEFQTAVPDGSVAFFSTEEAPGELHLFRYDTATHSAESVATKVKGLLGASEDGATAYFQDAVGLERWHEGAATATVAGGAEAALASDYPPTTGTARVSTDGQRLLFLSKASLTGYDNTDANTGQPDSEVFLYNAAAGSLTCVSCNPTNERPLGPSTIPGAISNGTGESATAVYKPRNLSTSSNRVFFTSADALVALDTNKASDAYQWEAQGTGTCAKPAGCLNLLSSGTDSEGASFIDASESGEDAYFLTSASLVPSDPGSADVYDARVGGGFPVPTQPILCEGDACQPLPGAPEDPTVGSLIGGPGNPPVHFPKVHKPKKKKHHKKKHAKGGKR
jgi:hypothetical protein